MDSSQGQPPSLPQSYFEECLERYAQLLIRHGLNVQPGQRVYLEGQLIHRDPLYRIARAAWQAGASYVQVDFSDPYLTRLRLLERPDTESLRYVPDFVSKKFHDMVDEKAAFLRILGSEEPQLLSDLDPGAVHSLQSGHKQAIRYFYQEGIGKSRMHWTLAACATPAWAKEVFPELPEKEALEALWKQIFTICRVDSHLFLERWKSHNETLHQRAQRLTNLKIEELHFLGGGTDLRVGLSKRALFVGGSSPGPYANIEYEPNIPTEECFTTPDWRRTEGKAVVTRPAMLNGTLVEGLELTFSQGELVHFSARQGAEMFSKISGADEGAKRLGEVALVGIDSPIYQSGRLFRETLFDENAACHIAIGSAYRFCLEGGAQMSEGEAAELGCNVSNTHCDLMISSEEVDVWAICHTTGEKKLLIQKGRWVE